MPMVSSKLGIGSGQGRVAIGFGLLNTVGGHNVSGPLFSARDRAYEGVTSRLRLIVVRRGELKELTRSGGLSCFDYAARNFWILYGSWVSSQGSA